MLICIRHDSSTSINQDEQDVASYKQSICRSHRDEYIAMSIFEDKAICQGDFIAAY
jgi:hypothetical protein